MKINILKRIQEAEKKVQLVGGYAIPDNIMISYQAETQDFHIMEDFLPVVKGGKGKRKDRYMKHLNDYEILPGYDGSIILELMDYQEVNNLLVISRDDLKGIKREAKKQGLIYAGFVIEGFTSHEEKLLKPAEYDLNISLLQ